jgi:hypothetical protein
MNHADPNRTAELARNVAVALRFKQTQGKPEMPQVEQEVLAPFYDRVRGGNLHLRRCICARLFRTASMSWSRSSPMATVSDCCSG